MSGKAIIVSEEAWHRLLHRITQLETELQLTPPGAASEDECLCDAVAEPEAVRDHLQHQINTLRSQNKTLSQECGRMFDAMKKAGLI